MLRNGAARRSERPWASPINLFPKKEDGWRPCGDYRALNCWNVPDQYIFRHNTDFAQQFAGRKMSTVDLVKAYHQIPVHSDDIAKPATITLLGLYEFLNMSFGLRNAAQTLQRFTD